MFYVHVHVQGRGVSLSVSLLLGQPHMYAIHTQLLECVPACLNYLTVPVTNQLVSSLEEEESGRLCIVHVLIVHVLHSVSWTTIPSVAIITDDGNKRIYTYIYIYIIMVFFLLFPSLFLLIFLILILHDIVEVMEDVLKYTCTAVCLEKLSFLQLLVDANTYENVPFNLYTACSCPCMSR